MKFNEMTYTRPDIDALLAGARSWPPRPPPHRTAMPWSGLLRAEPSLCRLQHRRQLANIHYTCDTRDAYWKAEQDFFDANGPAVTNASVEISRAFLANPHVDALTGSISAPPAWPA